MPAESLAFPAGIGVQREQLRIHGADVDDFLARLPGLRIFRFPIGDAPRLQGRLRHGLERGMRVEFPAHLAAGRAQREDPIKGGADVERSAFNSRSRSAAQSAASRRVGNRPLSRTVSPWTCNLICARYPRVIF